jgi:glucan phosphoethanolaminetransferase (alkaline phosphatase superfamily)
MIPRFLKAIFKTAIVYILFVIFSAFTIPFEGFYDYKLFFTAFVVLYMAFVFIIELVRGTIFQHIASIVNSLMIVIYFAYIFNTGIINLTVEQINLMVDLRFFLAIFVLGGLLGFAKSMLSLLNWMNEREEQWLKYQIKSL